MAKKQQQSHFQGVSGSNVYVPGHGFVPVKPPKPSTNPATNHTYSENDKSMAMGPGAIPSGSQSGWSSGSTTSSAGSAGASTANPSLEDYMNADLDPGASFSFAGSAPSQTQTQTQTPTQSSSIIIQQPAPQVTVNIPQQENRQFSMGNSSVKYSPLQDFEIRTF